jgi:hypothetical protein
MPAQRLGATYSAEAAGTAAAAAASSEAPRPTDGTGTRRLGARVRTRAGTLIQTAPVAKLAISALWAVHSDFLVAVVHHRNEISTPAERLFTRRRRCGALLAVEHWPPHSSIRERGNRSRSYGRASADRPLVTRLRGCESSHNRKTGSSHQAERIRHADAKRLSASRRSRGVTSATPARGPGCVTLQAQAQTAVPQAARYVTILIGANDVCTGSPATMTTVADFRAQFSAAMATLAARLANHPRGRPSTSATSPATPACRQPKPTFTRSNRPRRLPPPRWRWLARRWHMKPGTGRTERECDPA